MKFLPYLAIALCLLWHTVDTNSLKDEVSDLKARDTLHSNKISTLEGKIDLCAEEKKALIAEIREITRPLTRLIVVNGWVLGGTGCGGDGGKEIWTKMINQTQSAQGCGNMPSKTRRFI